MNDPVTLEESNREEGSQTPHPTPKSRTIFRRLGKTGLFIISLFLFILAITPTKAGRVTC
jgi:hypothetical protein